MHEVRKELKKTSVDPKEVLSEFIINNCKDTEFWRKLDDLDLDALRNENESNINNQTA